MRPVFTFFALLLATLALDAQSNLQPDPPHREWKASWITHPTAPLREPLVLHFRRTLSLAAVPATYTVRVSADNRFILYVNGHRVGDGPARGDLAHWRYERFDLAPLLQPGQNLITATVWNFGIYAPIAQMTDRTAFLLESEATGDSSISTPEGWQVEQEPGQRPLPRVRQRLLAIHGLRSRRRDRCRALRLDLEQPLSRPAHPGLPAASPMRESIYSSVNQAHSSDVEGDNPWGLVPDRLPHMVFEPTSPGEDRPHRHSRHLQQLSRRASHRPRRQPRPYPARPQDPHHRLSAAHRLRRQGRAHQAHLLRGPLRQGPAQRRPRRSGRPRSPRPDRQLPSRRRRSIAPSSRSGGAPGAISTSISKPPAEPLQLESLTANFTAYPFKERATFQSPDPDLAKIWEISWRTARLDAHETYMDTPYYEQLQYVGDTRIQALISYAVTGDDRLARQAIEAFDQSRISEGITRSRYPSSLAQNIPTFSLLWIGMVHDYWLYRPDPQPARSSLPGTRTVLDWFATHEQPDGLLDKLPWWSFIDWVTKGEIPTYDANGESCVTTLEYLGRAGRCRRSRKSPRRPASRRPLPGPRRPRALRHLRQMLERLPRPARRQSRAEKLQPAGQHPRRPLRRRSPKTISKDVLRRMLAIEPGTTPDGVLSASYYFRFYLARALEHAGMADEYLNSIDPWRKMLALHFSTWPEIPGEHPLRLPRLERAPHLRPAHAGSRHRAGQPRLRHGPHRSPPGQPALAQGKLSPSPGHDRGGISPPGRRTRRNHHSARHAHRQLRL